MIDPQELMPHLDRVISAIDMPKLPKPHSGKVRENFDLPDGRRIIIATDRLSAFDQHITSIPFKGQVLTEVARYWFEETAILCPNHVIDYPDPNVMVVSKLDMLPIEVIVRDYMAGNTETSLWTMYQRGQREMYGQMLPEGLVQYQKLPHTLITPTEKGAVYDEPVSPAEAIERGLLTDLEWVDVSDKAYALFSQGRRVAIQRGLILADTKYEFGRDAGGRIVLADEIHTPDSSRYWYADSYRCRTSGGEPPESFDKDVIRRWIGERCNPYEEEIPPIPPEVIAKTAAIYMSICERLTGEPFVIDKADTDPAERIRQNIWSYLSDGATPPWPQS